MRAAEGVIQEDIQASLRRGPRGMISEPEVRRH